MVNGEYRWIKGGFAGKNWGKYEGTGWKSPNFGEKKV
jgi:hypothetical protein